MTRNKLAMISHKLYLGVLIIFCFLLGALFEYFRCQHGKDNMNQNAFKKPHDTILISKDSAELSRDSILMLDTIYQRFVTREIIKNNLLDYVQDTLAPALKEANQVTVSQAQQQKIIKVETVCDGCDSIYYYKRLADSFKTECMYFQNKYRQLSISSKTKHDTLTLAEGDGLRVVNRWEYNKVLGIPINRQGYTDIYYGTNKPFSVKQDQNQFGLRFSVTGLYNFAKNQEGLGASLRGDYNGYQGSLIYYYNFQQKKMIPIVSLSRDIFRIH